FKTRQHIPTDRCAQPCEICQTRCFGLFNRFITGFSRQERANIQLPHSGSADSLGVALYFGSGLLYVLTGYLRLFFLYLAFCITGFLLVMRGGAQMSRILKTHVFNNDIFNRHNQSFPQEERYLHNEFSINLPAEYGYKDK